MVHVERVMECANSCGKRQDKIYIQHPKHWPRHPAWFKDVAILHALIQGFEYVLMMDFNPMLVKHEASIYDLKAAYAQASVNWTTSHLHFLPRSVTLIAARCSLYH